ncbi:hypothetical protein [Streptomyces sp. ok210]|jgi:hypothetical protein|uniref:DODA-type extradiol aromatic ring-opening family dioxygenase n=1 Tax=Streptomyces sp. ok210 TaxID=1761905 RepID=UPI0008ED1EEE|nr:hypothetical protein [Streptomyces sp. ok210]SFT31388.1 protocatechuate 4,5-dioxygenase, beta chain [Streptomyces sp. ok210]
MAEIVAVAGVPHTPAFPSLARGDTAASATVARRYAAVDEVVARADADVLVVLTCDHINTFTPDLWPTFAIATGDSVLGPNDDVPGVSPTSYALAGDAGAALHRGLVARDFDPVALRSHSVDHSVVVPLHFLNQRRLPVVPVYLNGMVAPRPSAERCRRLGRVLRDIVENLPDRRVAVVASGSFSLEVGGPRMLPDRLYGVPRPAWAHTVASLLYRGDLDGLVAATTERRIEEAGTVAGEILPWIAAAEMAADLPIALMDHRAQEGHAFAAWGPA